MRENRLSGPERGEQNVAKVRTYLAGLKAAGELLPQEDGRPNISAIAEAAGVLRNVFYTNSRVKRLLAEFMGRPASENGEAGELSRAQRQLEIKDRRILQLEQQLASVKAEAEELRKRLAAAEQKLDRYKLIEDVLQTGRRVVP
jgi:Family of unknown function (DUF6262)